MTEIAARPKFRCPPVLPRQETCTTFLTSTLGACQESRAWLAATAHRREGFRTGSGRGAGGDHSARCALREMRDGMAADRTGCGARVRLAGSGASSRQHLRAVFQECSDAPGWDAARGASETGHRHGCPPPPDLIVNLPPPAATGPAPRSPDPCPPQLRRHPPGTVALPSHRGSLRPACAGTGSARSISRIRPSLRLLPLCMQGGGPLSAVCFGFRPNGAVGPGSPFRRPERTGLPGRSSPAGWIAPGPEHDGPARTLRWCRFLEQCDRVYFAGSEGQPWRSPP